MSENNTRPLRLPPLPKALLSTLFIAQIVQYPGQAIEHMGILWCHRQHPFIERFGLAQLA